MRLNPLPARGRRRVQANEDGCSQRHQGSVTPMSNSWDANSTQAMVGQKPSTPPFGRTPKEMVRA